MNNITLIVIIVVVLIFILAFIGTQIVKIKKGVFVSDNKQQFAKCWYSEESNSFLCQSYLFNPEGEDIKVGTPFVPGGINEWIEANAKLKNTNERKK